MGSKSTRSRKKVKRFYPDLEEVPHNLDMKCSGKGACNSARVHMRTDKEPTELKGKNKDTNNYRELLERLEIASVPSPKWPSKSMMSTFLPCRR